MENLHNPKFNYFAVCRFTDQIQAGFTRFRTKTKNGVLAFSWRFLCLSARLDARLKRVEKVFGRFTVGFENVISSMHTTGAHGELIKTALYRQNAV